MPGIAYRSKLKPHWELIRTLREDQEKTWKEIADILETQCGCLTQPQGVGAFYKRMTTRKPALGLNKKINTKAQIEPLPSQQSNQQQPEQNQPAFLEPPEVQPLRTKPKYNTDF